MDVGMPPMYAGERTLNGQHHTIHLAAGTFPIVTIGAGRAMVAPE